MRQLLYVSTVATQSLRDELVTILTQSRRNNAASGVTGLLWTDGTRFLQVLEGEHEDLERAFSSISTDPRHKAVVVLHDRTVSERTFGAWSMALADDSDEKIAAALASADAGIRGTFQGFIEARRAA